MRCSCVLWQRGNSCRTGVHQRLMDANSSRAGRWQRLSIFVMSRLRATVSADQVQKRGNMNVPSPLQDAPPNVSSLERWATRNSRPNLNPEFLPTEEMPQTPPTKLVPSSNMDVFICGVPAVWNVAQLSMMGRPPSHVCFKCYLEGERKKSFPEFILFYSGFIEADQRKPISDQRKGESGFRGGVILASCLRWWRVRWLGGCAFYSDRSYCLPFIISLLKKWSSMHTFGRIKPVIRNLKCDDDATVSVNREWNATVILSSCHACWLQPHWR